MASLLDAIQQSLAYGEVFGPLCPLMDGRTHAYTLPLADPEGKSEAPNGAQGSISFELKYES